jgi:RNA polymerase sigma-70 factor, ECF subfamily
MIAEAHRPSRHASLDDSTDSGAGATNSHDDGLSTFMRVRPRLFGIAWRMLGSAAEAEDIVQDVWLRWQMTDRTLVHNAAAFLVTTTTRLAINVMQSARSRRETYGSLPEAIDMSASPARRTEQGEALESAVLTLLERLPARERAAYVLREAFDYRYREIATLLRLEEANTRQLVTRARQHVVSGRRVLVGSAERRRLVEAVASAARGGDVDGLEHLLVSDVVGSSVSACAA